MPSREEKFEQLFEIHADEIFRFVYFRVYDRELAKDLVQDTFLRAWSFELKEKVWNKRALLFKIARNLIIDNARQKRETYSIDQVLEQSGVEPIDKKDLDIELDGKMFLENLDKLKTDEQELITLRYLSGFSPREIAKMLERSVGVVSVQLTRAKNKLKQIYEDSIPKN
ncbi:MAG: RNA polymerase sigma factor [Parcubacteria group bacterium GW2011_GWC2_39_14]|nr:MAG: RNA polymerase sigma factor [Parcubacteria group bacterium GW2011_GWC2_39_14]KKR55302.1 MAG: RNA polymerase sigma factor [Parcubacteria group bacterium GW2011_GWA2_40_23]